MILVLEPDAPEEVVQELTAALERLDAPPDVSRGPRQVLVALPRRLEAEELSGLLERFPGIRPVPVLTGLAYRADRARRRFLAAFVTGLGALTAVGIFLPFFRFMLPPRRSALSRSGARVARLAEIPENSGRKVRVAGRPVLVVRQKGERLHAISATCTHMNVCEVSWKPERQQLLCPCHGGVFDLYGNVLEGPPRVPLPRYRVWVEDGDVLVESVH